MKTFPRWIVLLLLFIAAAASYAVGFTPGFGLFLGLGVLFEMAFWLKLVNRNPKK